MTSQNVTNSNATAPFTINLNDPAFDAVASTLGLQEITTQRQRANGSRAFLDPSVSSESGPVTYELSSIGYVRRTTPSGQYQLNSRPAERLPSGRTTRGIVLSRSSNESLGILVRGVTNFRRG